MKGFVVANLLLLLPILFVRYAIALENEPIAAEEPKSDTSEILVEDYLDRLSTAELETICLDRGFGLAPRDDGLSFQREDYLEAARRCLSLEDEMNAILAENPELAAELDAEVERMKTAKEKLEREREEMIAEKERLEEQLRNAGINMETNETQFHDGNGSPKTIKDASNLTFSEVMILTVTELYHRVMLDVRFMARILNPAFQPVKGVMIFMWKYARPTLGAFGNRAVDRLGPTWSKFAKQTLVRFCPTLGGIGKRFAGRIDKVRGANSHLIEKIRGGSSERFETETESTKTETASTKDTAETDRQEWPELVGKDGKEARDFIMQQSGNSLQVFVVPNDSAVTADFVTDRVRIWINDDGTVSRPPKIG